MAPPSATTCWQTFLWFLDCLGGRYIVGQWYNVGIKSTRCVIEHGGLITFLISKQTRCNEQRASSHQWMDLINLQVTKKGLQKYYIRSKLLQTFIVKKHGQPKMYEAIVCIGWIDFGSIVLRIDREKLDRAPPRLFGWPQFDINGHRVKDVVRHLRGHPLVARNSGIRSIRQGRATNHLSSPYQKKESIQFFFDLIELDHRLHHEG